MPQLKPCPDLSVGGHGRLPFETVALVLQGGGALGSYQAGVYQGLSAAGIEPNWIAGISIGALNAAVIAGNPPEKRIQRLEDFWQTICQPAIFMPPVEYLYSWLAGADVESRKAFSAFAAWRALVEGQRDFFVPRGLKPWLGGRQGTAESSIYDTAALKSTLERLIDFDRINHGDIRLSVGVVNVRTGHMEYFDNTRGPSHKALKVEHILASGALPPGFPAIEIDGEYYWDGGLVSNTPLNHVLEATPRRNTLSFQVDLWSLNGPLPENIYEVQERQKDIQYSSRTLSTTEFMANSQHYRRILRELLLKVPLQERSNDAWCQEAEKYACGGQYSVIQLIYKDKAWETQAKDYEFSVSTMREHWQSGLQDIQKTLANESWLQLPPAHKEFVSYDIYAADEPSRPALTRVAAAPISRD